MRFRLVAVLVLVAAAVLLVAAESAVVMGAVTYRNRAPASNITVSIGGKFAFTDVRGRYRIDGVPFGQQTMRFTRQGKVLKEVRLEIHENRVWRNEIIP